MKKTQKHHPTVSRTIIVVIVSLVSYVSSSTFSTQVIDSPQMHSYNNEQKFNHASGSLPYHQLPIYGNASLGYYYVKIYVGSPDPQPQSVIVDTGSGLLAVPGAQCKKCSRNHIDPPYDPRKSQSSKHLTCASKSPGCVKSCKDQVQDNQCTFSIYYAQGSSLQGFIVEDDIRFETYSNDQQIRTYFGYTDKQTNYFLTQKANGIFGLAPKRQTDLLEKMVQKHSPSSGQKLRFSLCLSSNGGIMTVGGLNQKLHKNKQQPDIIIPYNDKQNLYSLNGVKQISIKEELIHKPGDKFGSYGIFIDSGSTFSYLPRAKFNIFEAKLNKTCLNSGICEIGRGQDSTCYKLQLKQNEILSQKVQQLFPPIQFYILDKKIYWNSTKYLLVRQENQVCSGILGLDRYLLGANWMYQRDIVYDLENKNIEIYNNVQCRESSESMGRYLSNQAKLQNIDFKNKPQVRINMQSTSFIIGVVSLILALFILIFIKMGFFEEKKSQRIEINQNQDIDKGTQTFIVKQTSTH